MRVTDEHEQRAEALVARDHIMGPTAMREYLHAVERIKDLGRDGGYYASGTGGVDRAGGIWTTSGLSSPVEVRAQAYELLVLADLAEAATPEGTDGDA